MNLCPRDRQILASNEVGGYRYFSCELCHGFWIPGASLQRVFSAQGVAELRIKLQGVKSEIQCPDCHGDCSSLVIEGCQLDHCLHCHGVWLDSGEVRKLRHLFQDNSAVVLADGSRPSKETQQALVAWSIVETIGNLLLLVIR